MRDHLDRFGDTAVAVVTFAADTDRVAAHRRHLDLPFPILTDPDRSLYHRFGFGRGDLHRIWGLDTLGLYLRLFRRGRRTTLPTADTRQLGGDVVIDPAGRVAAVFRPDSPAGRPTVDELVAAVSRARDRTPD